MTTYNVSEIFTSIQGEGINSGRPAVLLRLSFCNLWKNKDVPSVSCNFCDTPQLFDSEELSERELLLELHKYRETLDHGLVITGGEPLLQLTPDLLKKLLVLFPWVDIETNGTISLEPYSDLRFEHSRRRLVFSCSPKTSKFDKTADQYKVLIPAKKDYVHDCASLVPSERLFLQPVEPAEGLQSETYKDNLKETIETAHRTGGRVCLQIHKLLQVR